MPAKLPHDPLTLSPVHITYRLKGSISRKVLSQLQPKRDKAIPELEANIAGLPDVLRDETKHRRKGTIQAKHELAIEQALHAITGDEIMYLQHPSVAKIIIDSWRYFHVDGEIYLYAVCVMGNHVHAIMRAADAVGAMAIGPLIRRHKSYTGRLINMLLKRGETGLWENNWRCIKCKDGLS